MLELIERLKKMHKVHITFLLCAVILVETCKRRTLHPSLFYIFLIQTFQDNPINPDIAASSHLQGFLQKWCWICLHHWRWSAHISLRSFDCTLPTGACWLHSPGCWRSWSHSAATRQRHRSGEELFRKKICLVTQPELKTSPYFLSDKPKKPRIPPQLLNLNCYTLWTFEHFLDFLTVASGTSTYMLMPKINNKENKISFATCILKIVF